MECASTSSCRRRTWVSPVLRPRNGSKRGASGSTRNAAKPSVHVKAQDRVSGTLPEPEPLSLEPEPLPLTILHEDPSIIVIDKPAGMVVHPASGNVSGTLVNALLHHCKDLAGINGVLRPGIVHRLDKGTSGVIVVAKDDEAYHHLIRQFKNRAVEKVYLAVAFGPFGSDEGVIDSAIGRHPSREKTNVHADEKGQACGDTVEGPGAVRRRHPS